MMGVSFQILTGLANNILGRVTETSLENIWKKNFDSGN